MEGSNFPESSEKRETIKIIQPEIKTPEIKKESFVSETPIIGDDLERRKKKVFSMLKKQKDWFYYVILFIIAYIGIYIRTRNIPLLKDVSTGTWTLGPDLDPFLFLRWAKYLIENGKFMALDMMRYVPLGYDTTREQKLVSFLIAGFHKIMAFFNTDITVTYSAIIFPVFMFALTTIAFFLFAKKVFYKESKIVKNTIALLSTGFFVLIPSLLYRTIAGIPEKESAAFFFLFLAFYLFLEAMTSKTMKRGIWFGLFAGISSGLMALTWGGMIMIFYSIPPAFLLAFLFGKVKKKEIWVYGSWLFGAIITMTPHGKSGLLADALSSTKYHLIDLIKDTSTGLAIGVFVLVILSIFIMKLKNNKLRELRHKIKLPKEAFSLIISILILIIIVFLLLGPSFVLTKVADVKNSLVSPLVSRFGVTVAENKQPYFVSDWKSSFGPIFLNLPLFFWMFFVGSVVLFHKLIKRLRKKYKNLLTLSYLIFLICLIFSKYSETSILNGTSGLSILIYFGGGLILLGTAIYSYYKINQEKNLDDLKEMEFSYILYFLILTLGIVAARGAVRFLMILGAVSPIAVAFLVVHTSQKYVKTKEEAMKLFMGIVAIVLIVASIFVLVSYYNDDKSSASNFGPGPYQWQWQKAMSWVRENTSENSVFAHWWDYGYWVQSIGERATVLDGANWIGYWNYLMGRHVLTGTDIPTTLNFLYTHNVTHLLIDSTEIGKYTAYSSIGSDENYDKFSWISTFIMDSKQTQETNNMTTYIYVGGANTDEDIIWEQDGKEILLPKRKAGVGAIILNKQGEGLSQPEAIYIYQGNQYKIPLRYLSVNGQTYDFEQGLDAGIFIFPSINPSSDGRININEIGALMYFSQRTVHTNLVQLYLFGEESEYFNLAHTESSYIIENLRSQGLEIGEFVYYQGFQGPIKIWEVSYPSNVEFKEEYLLRNFPNPDLEVADPGEY